jgi:UDP-N-acetylmuramoylalanine--D-glutamate ligase
MYLVAGLGITGQSVLRYFAAQGEPCLAFDTRESFELSKLEASFEQTKFAQGKLPSRWLNRFDTIVLSPGIAKSEPWVVALMQQGKQVIGDIELFARTVNVPVISITGSNGKSTVTTMTGMALQAAGYQVGVGGNIGEPVLDMLLDEHDYDVYVLELSSFQLETTYSLASVTATVLNISEDHMDRYPSMEEYVQAKMQVFSNAERAVLPQGFCALGISEHTTISRFGLSDDIIQSDDDFGVMDRGGENFLGFGKTPMVALSEMTLQGHHHQLNALAMMALCQPFDVEAEHFKQVVQAFTGLPYRTQLIGNYRGVEWVNDSKGTNVGATLTAIESLGQQTEGQLILLLGGVSKEADFSGLSSAIQTHCRHTIVFGRDQHFIATDLSDIEITLVETLEQAVSLAQSIAQRGDCVLFSPACASFDQFRNYMQRGDAFVSLVKAAYKSSKGLS